MKKKRLVMLLILSLLVVLLVACHESSDYNSQSIYVYNLTDDQEVMAVNADKKRKPASLVKIMTSYLALDHIQDLSQPAPVDQEAYLRAVDLGASMAGFVSGESTTYRDLLYGTMLASGAESADSLAVHIGGSVDDFVDMMNEKAEEIGLERTRYRNSDGMDQFGQYSTAKDTALLLKWALSDPDFRAIFTRCEYTSTPTLDNPQGLRIVNTVYAQLQNYSQSGFEIIGGKSGTTRGGGLSWATLAQKNDKEYIVVVMGADYDENLRGDGHVLDTLNILEEL